MSNTLKKQNVWRVKGRGVFRTQMSIYDGVFLWIYLTVYYFRNENTIIDAWLGYM